jgi:hypothetical protein
LDGINSVCVKRHTTRSGPLGITGVAVATTGGTVLGATDSGLAAGKVPALVVHEPKTTSMAANAKDLRTSASTMRPRIRCALAASLVLARS